MQECARSAIAFMVARSYPVLGKYRCRRTQETGDAALAALLLRNSPRRRGRM